MDALFWRIPNPLPSNQLRIPEPVERVLFVDDNPECVKAAEEVGFLARTVRGVAEVKNVLRESKGLDSR